MFADRLLSKELVLPPSLQRSITIPVEQGQVQVQSSSGQCQDLSDVALSLKLIRVKSEQIRSAGDVDGDVVVDEDHEWRSRPKGIPCACS
jgi:hypothetical protein